MVQSSEVIGDERIWEAIMNLILIPFESDIFLVNESR